MKPSKRSRTLYKQALININNAFDRMCILEESLNFQGFKEELPSLVMMNNEDAYGLALYWCDEYFDMEDIFKAFDDNLKITPRILYNLITNKSL